MTAFVTRRTAPHKAAPGGSAAARRLVVALLPRTVTFLDHKEREPEHEGHVHEGHAHEGHAHARRSGRA